MEGVLGLASGSLESGQYGWRTHECGNGDQGPKIEEWEEVVRLLLKFGWGSSKSHARPGGADGSGPLVMSPIFISPRQPYLGRAWGQVQGRERGQSSSLLGQDHLFSFFLPLWSCRSHMHCFSSHVSVSSVDQRKAGHPS